MLLNDMLQSTRTKDIPGGPTCAISLAWSAVAAADRVNGGEYISKKTFPVPADKTYNKVVAERFIMAPETLLPEDIAHGEKLAEHFAGLLFTVIKADSGDSFKSTIANIVGKKTVTLIYDVACMACLPNTYRKEMAREKKMERQRDMVATSEYLGQPESKIRTELEIMEVFYSQNYNSHIVTANDGKNLIKFFTAKDIDLFPINKKITITAKVKRLVENNQTGVKETWLNFVKPVAV